MSDIAIKVEGLYKEYTIGKSHSFSLREKLANLLAEREKEKPFWALKDVNFEINKGEVIGVIGKNGAGKSTLLKILSRITYPTKGRIELQGKVASLLEVGTGFHPELTGRENIYLNGSVLGMSRGEIKSVFDEIVDFSGVEKFIDTPVKRYSSGMYVRLAFAVAAHLRSDILLVDEVLSVGDVLFQEKCLRKLKNLNKDGKTAIIISHNFTTIKKFCEFTYLLREGKISPKNNSLLAISEFYDLLVTEPDYSLKGPLAEYFSIEKIELLSSHRRENGLYQLDIDEKIEFNVHFKTKWTKQFRIRINFWRDDLKLFSIHDGDFRTISNNHFSSYFSIPGSILRPGSYSISITGYADPEVIIWFNTYMVLTLNIYDQHNKCDPNAKGIMNVESNAEIISHYMIGN